MEPRLSQTQTQKLILAPQLRQFLKLLELPIFELDQRIDQELEQNPVLEESSPDRDEEPSAELESENSSSESNQVQDILQQIEAFDKTRKYDDFSQHFSENDTDEIQKKRNYQESILTKPPTLTEYLEWQLGLLDLSETERKIAEEIIGDINDDGQLAVSADELALEAKTPTQKIEKILAQIQSLDPPGVGGRSLSEILLIQLKKQKGETSLAQTIIREHMPLLERKQLSQLTRLLNVSPQRIKEAFTQISHLEPKPGRIFYQEKPNFVIPDAVVSISPEHEDELIIELNHEFIPSLRINPAYREMMKRKDLDPKTKAFLREKIQAGLDLVRAIAQRKSTMQQITEELVKAQRDFFTKGFSSLRPLRLKDIAEKIGVHESTVSRAIQGKYMDTPQGTIPYKSFFSSKLESDNGVDESQKSALERLKRLIGCENKQKPLSDAKLVELLQQEGIKVARRTVAKYRYLLKILPAYLRKNNS